jgi:hypothetical protein
MTDHEKSTASMVTNAPRPDDGRLRSGDAVE